MVEQHEGAVLLAQEFLGHAAFAGGVLVFGRAAVGQRWAYGISRMRAASLRVIFGSNPPL